MKDPIRPPFISQERRLKWVPGYDGLYAITDHGSVISYHSKDPLKMSGGMAGNYETVSLSKSGEKQQFYIHRLVLKAFVGPCPEGMQCCHNNGKHCDNRLQNLRWDTPKANSYDRSIHGAGSHKLTTEDVVAIRESFEENDTTFKDLGSQFGISGVMVGNIVRGEVWKHAGGPISKSNTRHGSNHQNAKLDEDMIRRIRSEYENKPVTQRELAERFSVSVQTICDAVNLKGWDHVS